MTVLLVGADQLGNIPKELEKEGCKNILHWSGRKKMAAKKVIPNSVDFVIVFSDFVNHNLMGSIKEQAKTMAVPVIFSKRGTSCLKKCLDSMKSS